MPVFAFLDLNPVTMAIVGAIGVLLFGERLPEVSRKVGKHLMDFKKGIREIQDQVTSAIDSAGTTSTTSSSYDSTPSADGTRVVYEDQEEHEEASAPKFEPPPQQTS